MLTQNSIFNNNVGCDAKMEHLVAQWNMWCHNIASYDTTKYYDVTKYHHDGDVIQHCDTGKAFGGKMKYCYGRTEHCNNIIYYFNGTIKHSDPTVGCCDGAKQSSKDTLTRYDVIIQHHRGRMEHCDATL